MSYFCSVYVLPPRVKISIVSAQMNENSSLGTIVTVGDPKKKYTKFEKIGQG